MSSQEDDPKFVTTLAGFAASGADAFVWRAWSMLCQRLFTLQMPMERSFSAVTPPTHFGVVSPS